MNKIKRTVQPKDELPPYSEECEQGALGCAILAGDLGLTVFGSYVDQLSPDLFYDLRHRKILEAIARLRQKNTGVDSKLIMLAEELKQMKAMADAGGLVYVASLPDKTPSVNNFAWFLEGLQKFAARRFAIRAGMDIVADAKDDSFDLARLRDRISNIADVTAQIGEAGKRGPAIKLWNAKTLHELKISDKLCLVGDNEINMGYDGITLIAGPGGCGKSLVASSLALAGAIGSGLWQGRKVHRAFKTLVIQSENGVVRLKGEFAEMSRLHPDMDIAGQILVCEPPEGGIPFDRPQFRSAVRQAILEFKPDLVIVDPWSAVAVEDAAKDIVDKLGEIRSCFPAGEACPGLLIIAHLNKPRAEIARKGRGMIYLVTGSVAFTNTARCVYLLLPWSDDYEDDRIFWCCSKLNNGKMYSPTVWKRRLGTFFDHDDQTDASGFGKSEENGRKGGTPKAVSRAAIIQLFDGVTAMRRKQLVTKLVDDGLCSEPTAMRITNPALTNGDNYVLDWIELLPSGMYALKM